MFNNEKIETAKITKIDLEYDNDRFLGLFHLTMVIEGNGWSAMYAPHAVLGWDRAKSMSSYEERYDGWEGLSEFLMRLMDVVGVRSFKKLKGKEIRVKVGSGSSGIRTIGNMKEDKWMDYYDVFNELNIKYKK